eukprot:TRINITY_DN19041_c0_g1_i1.p1 TRINITY_DN19041_c0_g1~~TRINITY_DN19041_c0_g1_i1.p1  ORF type:complete len:524 (+),score=220.65 TRINITY_DN19041_c0_g1_i1:34-1605(+)
MALAEPRRRQKWTLNPRGNLWANDTEKFGLKLMEKMGYEQGKGLGAKKSGILNPISVRQKSDSKGIGFDGHDDTWLAHQDDFQAVLSSLNVEYGNEEAKEAGKKSLEQLSKKSRKRVHYQRFTRGKDLANYSAEDLGCILGTNSKKLQTKQKERENEDAASNDKKEDDNSTEIGTKEHSHGLVTIQGGNYHEYFQKKMAELRAKGRPTFSGGAEPASGECETSENKNDNDDATSSEQTDKTEDSTEEEPPKKKKKSKKEKVREVEVVEELVVPDTENVDEKKAKKKKKKDKKEREEDQKSLENEDLSKKKKSKKDVDEVENDAVAQDSLIQEPAPSKKKKKSKAERIEDDSTEVVENNKKSVDDTSDSLQVVDVAVDSTDVPSKKKKKKKEEKEKEKESLDSPEERQDDVEEVSVKKKKKKKDKNKDNVEIETQHEELKRHHDQEKLEEEPPKKRKKKSGKENSETSGENNKSAGGDVKLSKKQQKIQELKKNSSEENSKVSLGFKGACNLLKIAGYGHEMFS